MCLPFKTASGTIGTRQFMGQEPGAIVLSTETAGSGAAFHLIVTRGAPAPESILPLPDLDGALTGLGAALQTPADPDCTGLRIVLSP